MAQEWDAQGNPVAPPSGQSAPKEWDAQGNPVTGAGGAKTNVPGLTPGSPNSGAAERFAGGVARVLNPVPGIRTIAGDPQGLKHGIEQNLFQPQADELAKAGQAARGKGEFSGMTPIERASETFGHGAAGVLPLVGPAAARAGETIGSGDVAGGLGEAAGLGLATVAPDITRGVGGGLMRAGEPIAENALGIRGVDRKFGRNPGKATLEETSGVRPDTVSRQAESKIAGLSSQRDSLLRNSPTQVSLKPARDVISDAKAKAAAGNSSTSHLDPIQEQLTLPRAGFAGATSGNPLRISELQDPMNALAIRQRLGEDFTKFDMARPVAREASKVGNKAYGALTGDIHRAVPGSEPLDTRISNLIPVKESADVRKLGPDTTSRIMTRIARPTGALIGADAGYRAGGLPGAVMGLVAPELLSSPTAQLAAARTLYGAGKGIRSPITGNAVRALQLAGRDQSRQ